MSDNDRVWVKIHVPREMHRAMRKLAIDEGRPVTELYVEAFTAFVDSTPPFEDGADAVNLDDYDFGEPEEGILDDDV